MQVDFEEFCLLMLRMKRAATTPPWLLRLFVPAVGDDEPSDDEDETTDRRGSPSVLTA